MSCYRTHPRTLNEAFPRTAEYGAAIERPAPPFARSRGASIAVAVALCLGVLAIVLLGEPSGALAPVSVRVVEASAP